MVRVGQSWSELVVVMLFILVVLKISWSELVALLQADLVIVVVAMLVMLVAVMWKGSWQSCSGKLSN